MSGYLLVENSYYQRAGIISSSNKITGAIYATKQGVSDYLALKSTNEELAIQNANLYSKSPESFFKLNDSIFSINDTIYRQQYKYIAAKVINNSVNKRSNYLTLDKGSDQGILPEMGVIMNNGIVGIVKQVSKNFSSVLSVLHKSTRISAKLKKNDYFGSLTWDGNSNDFGTLNDIPKHVQLVKGDTIVTSAYSAIFPQGVMIGTIDDFEIYGDNFYNIKVKFSTDFYSLTYVYVIHNILKEEQHNLELISQNDK